MDMQKAPLDFKLFYILEGVIQIQKLILTHLHLNQDFAKVRLNK